jgi:nitrilase
MIVLPTAWIFPQEQLKDPAFRQDCVDIWRAMAKTRAYDNVVYFVVCNQTGIISPVMEGLGNSMVVSPYGKIEASLDTKEGVIKADLDFSKVDIARDEFPVQELI